MAAGTIAVTNGGNTIAGVGTSFTTELKPNDFVYFDVGQTTYMVSVDSITSNTSIKLNKPYRGASATGLSWGVVPLKGLALVSAQSVKDMAEYMRSSVLDKVNWQGVFSELDQVTVTLLDGSVFTGPSWKKISEQLAASDANVKALLKRMIRLGEVQWHHGTRSTIPTGDGWIAADGQLLDSTFSDLWAIRDRLPGATLATWTNSGDAAAPWKYRTRYVKSSQAEFRAPDFNGVVTLGGVKSLGHLFLAGAGGDSFSESDNAQVYGQAAPNVTSVMDVRRGITTSSAAMDVVLGTGGSMSSSIVNSNSNNPVQLSTANFTQAQRLNTDLSSADGTYGRNSGWLYPHNASGVWIIRAKYPTF